MGVGISLKLEGCPFGSYISPHCLVPMCGVTSATRDSRMQRSRCVDKLVISNQKMGIQRSTHSHEQMSAA